MSLYRAFLIRDESHANAAIALIKGNWSAMAQSGKPMSVTVQESGSKRTTDQNKRLHAILTDIANQAWVNGRQYDVETWKEYARQKYIGVEEIDMPDGSRIKRGISTTTLNVAEFANFMNQIELDAAENLGVELV